MPQIIKSATFDAWLSNLQDRKGVALITARIDRLAMGHAGDVKRFDGITEMRIHYGPGYRVYYKQRGRTVVLLLCGGNKTTQTADIKQAIKLAKDLE